jgi:hypothetical protein
MRVPVGAEGLSPFCVVERTIDAFSNIKMLLKENGIFARFIVYNGSIFARFREISNPTVSTIWGDGGLFVVHAVQERVQQGLLSWRGAGLRVFLPEL